MFKFIFQFSLLFFLLLVTTVSFVPAKQLQTKLVKILQLNSEQLYCTTPQHYQKMKTWIARPNTQLKIRTLFFQMENPVWIRNRLLQNYRNFLVSHLENNISFVDGYSQFKDTNFGNQEGGLWSLFCSFPDLEADLNFALLDRNAWKEGNNSLIKYHLLRIWLSNLNVQLSFYGVKQKLSDAQFVQLFPEFTEADYLFQSTKTDLLPFYWTFHLKPYSKTDSIPLPMMKLVGRSSKSILNSYLSFTQKADNSVFVLWIGLILVVFFAFSSSYSSITNSRQPNKTV